MSIKSQVQPELIFDTEATKIAYGAVPDKTLVYVEETKIHWIYDNSISDYRILTTTSDVFVQTNDKTVANTTVETTLLDSGTGIKTLPANFLNTGRDVHIEIKGYFSRQNGNETFRVKLNSTTILTTGAILIGSGANDVFEIEAHFTIRTSGVSGTLIGQGKVSNLNTGNVFEMVMTSPISINTTITQTIDVTIQWSNANAGNSITSTNANIII